MKKFLLTLTTLFSSHAFSAGNLQAMQGRFNVNTGRCQSFQTYVPSRAFISAQSADSLLVEFLGSEAREILVHVEDGAEVGRNGRESYRSRWSNENIVVSSRTFVNDRGSQSVEVTTVEVTSTGLTLTQVLDGKPTLACELVRNK